MQSVVQSTVTTTSTVLSVLATDSLAAASPLRSMGSSVQDRASLLAEASRPANTNAATTVRETVTAAAGGGSGGSSSGSASKGNVAAIAIVILAAIVILV